MQNFLDSEFYCEEQFFETVKTPIKYLLISVRCYERFTCINKMKGFVSGLGLEHGTLTQSNFTLFLSVII